MKKILLFITFLFCLNILGQKNVTLYFRNGDSLKVISHINSGNSKIRYREKQKAKRITINYRKVLKAVQHYSGFNRTYVFKKKEGYEVPVILEQVYSGEVDLFKMDFTRNSNFGNGMTMSSNETEYYVSKKNSNIVTTFNASGLFIENGFRKKSTEFFKDCPEVVNKINDKIWKMKDIPEIVRYYDTECN
jgi:hypothetical protein